MTIAANIFTALVRELDMVGMDWSHAASLARERCAISDQEKSWGCDKIQCES